MENVIVIDDSPTPSGVKISRIGSGTSTKTPALVHNPYKRKAGSGVTKTFIGGAEAARRKAKKSPGNRIMRPGEQEKLDEVLPRKMNPMERFFAAILRSAPTEFVASDKDAFRADQLWKKCCSRVGLVPPTSPIRSSYRDAQTHFAVRAALVLEEARVAVAQPLTRKFPNNAPPGRRPASSPAAMILTAHLAERQGNNGHVKISFVSTLAFTKEQLFHIRPGSVFALQPRESGTSRSLRDLLLGVIMSSNRETVEKKRLFTVTIFREADLPIRIEDEEWRIEPVCTLISELRCFEAMVSVPPHNIALLTALLGQKTSKHTKFPDSDFLDSGSSDDDTEIIVLEPSTAKPRDGSIQEYFAPKIQSQTELLPFRLPWLNETQEKAAQTFLNSKPSSITLIQGPPGTGKTTLLVSVIARYLMKFATVCTSSKKESSRRRIMVCAPTNKAIAVLASRFLASVYPNEDSSTVFNAVMVGDAEKLLVDERNRTVKSNVPDTLPLKSIFVFSWMQGVMDDYRSIKNFFVPGQVRGWEREDLYKLARRLETRLISSLPGMPTSVGKLASKISNSLKRLESGGAAHGIVENIDKVLQQLKDMPQDHIYRELLLSADIIFCTLASAGGLLLRMTSRIDDLIVDEAAAATEPELCIPLHLQPSRLLCVGDPKQLPATLLSRKAVDLGLSKSLQERLMYDCKQQHIMLDVQYRMNPQISSFPSRCFYEDKIQNGENVSSAIYESGPLLMQGRPYAALHVEGVEEQGVGGSYRNEAEARVVVDLIDQLRTRAGSNNPHWHSTDHVRIITFYQAQVGLLKRLLRDRGLGDKIVVATVDSSQGCEADTVIVSFVRSPNTKNAGNEMIRHTAGFLTDDRRMNVALTRAKYQLVCVGNIHGMVRMEGAVTLQELSANAREREVIQTWPLGSRTSNINGKAIHDKLDLFYGECDNRKRPSKKMRW